MLVVTSRQLVKGDFKKRIELIDKADIDAIVLREKDWTKEECEKFLKKVSLSHKVFVNNSNMRNYSYISVPFSEFEYSESRKTIVSLHSVDEAKIAEDRGANAIIAGHIFATDCKRGLEPRGLEFLDKVCRAVSIPVFAIGGINEKNTRNAMEAGAFGVALMSSAMIRDNVVDYLNEISVIEKEYRNK